MYRPLTPAMMPLCTIVIAILSAMHYIPFYIGGVLCGGLFLGTRYHSSFPVASIVLSACLGIVSGFRLYTLWSDFAELQKHAGIPHNGIARVYDIDPPRTGETSRMATITVTTETTGTYTCKVRVPHNKNILPDDLLHIRNMILPQNNNPDFAWYLIREELAGFIYKTPKIYVLHRPYRSMRRWICQARDNLLYTVYHQLPQEHAAIVSHLFLGYKATPQNTRQQFETWGISHLLARSGLHLATFTAFCSYIFQTLPCYYLVRDGLALLLTTGYAICSWPSVSFIRAFCMLLGYYLCRFLQIRYHAHHWVILSAIGLLCYNPMHLFFLDFQLSFTLTWTLCWMFSHILTRTQG